MSPKISRDDLYTEYVIHGLSTRDIARKYNTAQTNVRRWMKYYNIEARSSHEHTQYYLDKMRPKWDEFKTSNKKWHTKECEWCHREFEINCNNRRNRFCSKECVKQYQRSKREKYYCVECGAEIEYSGRNYPRKYCDKCVVLNNHKQQKDRILTHCGYCGKELYVIKSRYEKQKYCYCNEQCMAKHYSEIYTGENSPTWNGGKRHYTGGWLQARNEARQRDNYSCQMCGITEQEYGKEMSVHHIKKYKSFDDKFEANQLENLVCLCEHCHRFVHSNKNTDQIWIKK